MGINILLKARKGQALEEKTSAMVPLGLADRYLDAVGNGGKNLLSQRLCWLGKKSPKGYWISKRQ